MITDKNIQIGNLVLHRNNNTYPTWYVITISIEDLIILSEKNKDPEKYEDKEYMSIKLTPEWLKMLGFSKHKNSNEYWTLWSLKNGWGISEAHHNEPSAGVVSGNFYFSDEYIEMKSVHWLQNFYYLNTSEELTFIVKC